MLTTFDLNCVELFLKTCKREILKGNSKFIDSRILDMNGKRVSARQALLDLGIIKSSQIWNYILALKKEECFRVSRDYDHHKDFNSEIFEFIHLVKGHPTYIKLTINNEGTICLSFHKSYKYKRR